MLNNIKRLLPDGTIYIVSCLIAIWIAYALFSASYVGDGYIPNSHDSFYHARRIIDAASGNFEYFEFDKKIHAPEGSWLTWPWAYDYLLAKIISFTSGFSESISPMSVLVRIPPFWLLINMAIFLWVVKVLRFSFLLRSVALFCLAISPLTQELHGFAVIDHHYFEYTFVLLALAAGMQWMRNPSSAFYAALLGIVLGMAPAFHNSLFILQLPIILLFLVTWVKDEGMPNMSVMWVFCLSIILTTLIFLMPSAQFRDFQFHYYVHSWFHLYAAFSTALIVAVFSVFQYSIKRLSFAFILMLLLAIPSFLDVSRGLLFLSGEMLKPYRLYEYQSLLAVLKDGRWLFLTERYSGMIWSAPIIVVWAIRRIIVTEIEVERYFAIYVLFGLVLLFLQLRMQCFGSFSLYLPFLYILSKREYEKERYKIGVAIAIILLSYLPGSSTLFYERPLGLSSDYDLTRSIYPALKDVCDKQPGVVLADQNDGHYIRYHTDCSVISNNMLQTPQHLQKSEYADYLFSLSVDELLVEAPYVRYIYIRREDNPFEDLLDQQYSNKGLREALLFKALPDSLEVVKILDVDVKGEIEPFARLYRVL